MSREPWQITREMFLSVEETERLLTHVSERVKGSHDAARPAAIVDEVIIQSLLFSGVRNSEFCHLRVADTIVGTGKSVFVVCGTPREDRTVYVPRSVSGLIRRYVAEVRPSLLGEGIDPKDRRQPLIFNERGKPYERTGLYRRVVRILTEAGLADRASVQLLRHTYGYLAYLRSGGNLLFVQKQLGHAHPMVTSIYAQFVEEDYAGLAERLFVEGQRNGVLRRGRVALK